jgi:TrkA-N domain
VRRHRLGFVALLALGALVLGFIGYLQAHRSVVDAAYGTLSLLAFNYYGPLGDEPIPATLEVARFIVPAVAALATFTALVALLEDQWHLVRARFCREHVVVCGLGRRGHCLVRSLRAGERPATVVAIESDRANPNVEAARRLGAIVLIGDATEPDVLHSAALRRASTLVSVLPDDAHNAAVASLARGLCAAAGNELTALCHVSDLDLVEDLTSAALGAEGGGFALEWFSVPARAARLMLAEHAGLIQGSRDGRPPHLVVIGSDELARALVLNAARQWRALAEPGTAPLRVTIVDEGAAEWARRFADRYPSAPRYVQLQAYEEDLRARAHAAQARHALDDATAVFVCAADDTAGLELGFAAIRTLTPPRTVVVRLQLESAFDLLELPSGEGEGGEIRLFSVVERTCSAQMIADSLNETLARALHDVYRRLAERAPGGEDDGRPLVPWDELEKDFRQSSRAQARHLASKLRESGCAIRPLTDWDAPPLEFDEFEVERLGESEHVRWNRERKARGWVSGPRTERERRVSEWIDVPWEDLPPEIADYDREFVRALPTALAAAGYDLYRVRADGAG